MSKSTRSPSFKSASSASPKAASSKSAPRAAVSVLDRLLDERPDLARDAPVTAAQSLAAFRRAVHRDVEHLLNARCPWHTPMSRALRATPLGYGISDFTAGAFNDAGQQEALRVDVEDALRTFEPRLANVEVQIIEDGQPLRGVLKLRINAVLLVEPLPETICFDSLIDTTTADIMLRPLTD